MGSGSSAGGGSGARGGGGGTGFSGSGWSAPGRYKFGGQSAGSTDSSPEKVKRAVTESFKVLARHKEYILRQIACPLVEGVYRELFTLKVELFDNKSWAGLKTKYGVNGGAGCLQQWARAVISMHEMAEFDQRLKGMIRVTLDDFLYMALGDDIDCYVEGNATAVCSKLEAKFFLSTSSYFLATLLRCLLDREKEKLAEGVEQNIQHIVQELADKIIHSFEQKFHARNQVTHRDLFSVIRQNPEWFLEQLKHEP